MPNFSTLIIDTMCLLHRAKHISCNPNKPGQQNCVIIGFLKEIKHLIETFHTDDLIFCFDSKKSIRKELFPKYQYKRHDKSKKSEEEIKFDKKCSYQFEIIKHEILPSMGFNNVFLQTKYEADDLIAKIVMNYPPDQFRFIIVSIDQDLFQLLDYADIYDPGKRKLIQYKDFWHEYKLQPKDWIDFKATAGCASDKVPGIAGVGKKSALAYLRGEEVKQQYLNKIEKGQDQYQFCKQLVQLPYPGTKLFKIQWNNFAFEPFKKVCEKYHIFLPNKLRSFFINLLEDLL